MPEFVYRLPAFHAKCLMIEANAASVIVSKDVLFYDLP